MTLEVERLVASPDGFVAVQDEDAISLLDVKTGDLSPILPERRGRELVALLNGRRVLAFHEDSGLVGFDGEGKRFGHADLGDEAEFADARVLGDGETAVILIAEMVGEEMGLSTARYRFVLVAQRFALVKTEGGWSRWPRVWGVDQTRRRLIVATAQPGREMEAGGGMAADSGMAGGGEMVEFDLATGKRMPDSGWLKTCDGGSLVTGLDVSADDGRAAIATHAPKASTSRLVIVDSPGSEAKLLVDAAGSDPVRDVLWSPDGARLLYRTGFDESHEVSVAKVDPAIGKVKPKVLCRVDSDANVVWCGRKRVVAVVGEKLVQVFDV